MAGKTIKIKLQSTESPYFTTSTKNPQNRSEKLQLNKYDPTLRKHVLFKEAKVK